MKQNDINLDLLSFVSRQDSESEASLRNFAVQEAYFEHLQQKKESKVVGLRKLREGLLSSDRRDSFAIEVYEWSVRECLEEKNFAELFKSLSHLVEHLYILETTNDKQLQIVGLHLLFLICSTDGLANTHKFKQIVSRVSHSQNTAIQFAEHVLAAFIADLDFLSLSRCWETANIQQRLILEMVLPQTRVTTLAIIKGAYYTFPANDLARLLCLDSCDALSDYLSVELQSAAIIEPTVRLRQAKK